MAISDHPLPADAHQTGDLSSTSTTRQAAPTSRSGVTPPEARATNHLTDVKLWLRTMQVMVDHWLAYESDDPVQDAWKRDPVLWSVRMGEIDAWRRFAQGMNKGLEVYRARVELIVDPHYTENAPRPDLFCAMCVQLFNVMAEGLPMRWCANCGNPFLRQQGRARENQNRTEGVKFCTPQCANADAQRAYRARKKLEAGK